MTDFRTARVMEREDFDESCRLVLEVSDGRPLGFVGGQYVIVDTGLSLPDGKKRKRAYSIMSSDAEQQRFELAARRLEFGLGSQWISDLPVGAELRFSGPWGKLRAPSASEHGPVWVIATDTGVTAALGLVAGQGFAPRLIDTRFVWWTESPTYFLSSEAFFSSMRDCGEIRLGALPAIGSAQRLELIEARMDELFRRGRPDRVYVIGDGHVCTRSQALLEARGVERERVQVETFFHHVQRKASSERAA
jgi:ferredoxin-NADP reductase